MKFYKSFSFLVFFFLLFTFSSKSFAQPVADSSWLPKAGDIYYSNKTNMPVNFDKNITGANIVWDFSDIEASTIPFDTSNYVLPANINLNCYYLDVDLINRSSNRFSCLLKDSSGFYFVGRTLINNSNTTKFKYSKKELILKLPFTYNDTVMDTSAFIYSAYIDSNGHKVLRDSAIASIKAFNIVCDGYGSLKLHNGLYNNVLRIKTITFSKDSAIYYNSGINKPYYNTTETYAWRHKDFHEPLFAISYSCLLSRRSNNSFDTTSISINVTYKTVPTSGYSIKNTNELSIKAYTTTEGIRIEGNDSKNQQLSLSLYNMQGKLVLHKEISLSGSYLLPVQRMPAGKYILQVHTKEGANKSFSFFLN